MNLPNINTFKEHVLLLFNKQPLPPNVSGNIQVFNNDRSLASLVYKDLINDIDMDITYFSNYVVLSGVNASPPPIYLVLYEEIEEYQSASEDEKFQKQFVLKKETIFMIEMHIFMKQYILILEY